MSATSIEDTVCLWRVEPDSARWASPRSSETLGPQGHSGEMDSKPRNCVWNVQ
jgi:hypothetical protein